MGVRDYFPRCIMSYFLIFFHVYGRIFCFSQLNRILANKCCTCATIGRAKHNFHSLQEQREMAANFGCRRCPYLCFWNPNLCCSYFCYCDNRKLALECWPHSDDLYHYYDIEESFRDEKDERRWKILRLICIPFLLVTLIPVLLIYFIISFLNLWFCWIPGMIIDYKCDFEICRTYDSVELEACCWFLDVLFVLCRVVGDPITIPV